MNRKIGFALICLLAFTAVGSLSLTPTKADPGIILEVEPEVYTASYVSEEFPINITINNVEETSHLVGVEFRLSFNDTLLNVTNCAEGSFLAQFDQGLGTWFSWWREGNCTLVGNLLFPDATGGYPGPFPEGSGTIATVTFHALYLNPKWSETPTECNLTLIETLLVDADKNYIDHTTEDGYYQIIGVLLSVEPQLYTATYFDEEFPIDITINNVDAGLKLVGVEFRLSFNDTLLNVTNCAEGSFLAQFDQGLGTWFSWWREGNCTLVGNLLFPDATGGYPGPFPEGSGTIATVTFHALYQPSPVGCTLELIETLMVDANKRAIPHTTRDGYYQLPEGPVLSVEPQLYTATYFDEEFPIDITINNVDAGLKLVGVEFRLSFNATLLKVVDCVEGSFLAQFDQGQGTWFSCYIEENGHGPHVLVGNLLLPPLETGVYPGPFPEGSGTIATVTFHALYQGRWWQPPVGCALELFDTLLVDADENHIVHATRDGYYEIQPPIITGPMLSVEPGEYHASTKGETFNINVTISNLDEALYAVAVEFRLSFNDTLLEVVNCTEGPFLAQFNQTPTPPYTWFSYYIEDAVSPHVLVGNLLFPDATGGYPGPFPEGNGTIATVTFHALYQEKGINVVDGYEKPPLTCDLTLFETLLIDNEGYYIDHYTKPGSYEISPTNVGDVNGDGKVRVDDVLLAAEAFGTKPDHPRWNPDADINGDGKVRVDDIYIVARNFGWTA